MPSPLRVALLAWLAVLAVPAGAQPPLTVKALSWNVEQPQGGRLRGVIEFLVRQNADVIALQEIYEGEAGEIRAQLAARTSKPWTGRFHRGVMLLTHFPILDQQDLWMPFPDRHGPGRPAVGITVDVNGGRLRVFNAHLSCCDDIASRQRQVNALTSWMANHGQPAIVAGDFNAVPTDAEIGAAATPHGTGMAADYVDVWRGAGGETHRNPSPSRRIDYWFRSKAGAGTLTVAQPPRVLDVCTGWSFSTAEAGEGGPSCLADHRPVEATFRLVPRGPAAP